MGLINDDASVDIAVANRTGATVSLFINQGTGVFAAAATQPTGGGTLTSVVLADVDGASGDDLVVFDNQLDHVAVRFNSGSGTFPTANGTYDTGQNPATTSAVDLDGNGSPDLVAVNSSANTISVLLNQGNGTFAAQVTYSTGRIPVTFAAGDLDADGDGDLDLIVDNANDDTFSVLLNDGAGALAPQVTWPIGTFANGMSIGDVNGDGAPAIVVPCNPDFLAVVLADCVP